MTNRRLFLSSLGLAAAAIATAGCGEDGTPVPPTGSGADPNSLPEGERLAEESLDKLKESKAKGAGTRKKH